MTSTCFNKIFLLRKLHHTFESISVYTILMEHKFPSKTPFTFPQTQQANFVQYQIQGRSNKKLGRNVRWVPSPVISRAITPGVITPIGINWLFLRVETTPFITSRGPPCVNKHDFSPRQIILRPPIPVIDVAGRGGICSILNHSFTWAATSKGDIQNNLSVVGSKRFPIC